MQVMWVPEYIPSNPAMVFPVVMYGCESWTIKKAVKVAQSCPTLCNPLGILQARILEWVAFPFFRGSSQPKDQTQVSRTAGRCFTSWATREAQEYWSGLLYSGDLQLLEIPSPEDLPNTGIKLGFIPNPALLVDSLPTELSRKAECWRIDAFKLWYWRRLLIVPWTARRSNQSILKEISPECSDVEAETPRLWPPDAKS